MTLDVHTEHTAQSNKSHKLLRSFLRIAAHAEKLWIRRWPFSTGKYAVLRFHNALYSCNLLRPTWVVVEGVEYWLDSRNYIAQELLTGQLFSKAIIDFVKEHLSQRGTFVDVGANHGYVAIPIAKARPEATILAIEPDPRAATTLRDNLSRNRIRNVQVLETACGLEPGTLPLYLSPMSNLGNNSLSSANARSTASVEVPVRQLDEIVLTSLGHCSPDVMKIDTEGAEMMVLGGATKVLASKTVKVVMELEDRLLSAFDTSKRDVIDHLRINGYKCTGNSCDSDFTFVPQV